jgi:Fe-S-cluster containining protein
MHVHLFCCNQVSSDAKGDAMAASNNEQTIEIRLEVIAASAEPTWADNWNFRSYLFQNVPSELVDQTVHTLNKEISSKIDCTKCGHCCREIQPFMDANDIAQMAEGLKETSEKILAQTKPEDHNCVSFLKKPCPMLKDNKCTVYQFRPRDCQEYPHLDKPDFLAGSVGTIENYGTCPIVFNVYNRLKTAFSYDPNIDYIGDSNPEDMF